VCFVGWPVPVAARSKAWVCGRSPAEIMGSNPTGGMDVCLLWVLCVVRGLCDKLITSRGVLPTVMRRCVWSRNLVNGDALAHWGAVASKTKILLVKILSVRWKGWETLQIPGCRLYKTSVTQNVHSPTIYEFFELLTCYMFRHCHHLQGTYTKFSYKRTTMPKKSSS